MTELARLKVSLTKHNGYKVARLLKDHPTSEIFDHLDDDEVKVDPSQARKILSTLSGDALPALWSSARVLGPDAIDALVLVAIIFSHHELIDAMANASNRKGLSGRIRRDKQVQGKAYTNLARWIDQLGFASRLDDKGVTFDLKPMFELPGLGPVVKDLLELKLLEAKWDKTNSVPAESKRLGLHKVFGVSPDELSDWLDAGAQPSAAESTLLPKDEEFFQEETEGSAPKKFEFEPGHVDRDVDPLTRAASKRSKANRLHNDIQNKLYAHLKSKLGAKSVGTELDTGTGTAIDVATEVNNHTTFYEIKTGASVRASIRQALPQLLEYAYWPSDRRADELVIVSHLPATPAAEKYLKFLRAEFNLPLSYKQFDLATNTLR